MKATFGRSLIYQTMQVASEKQITMKFVQSIAMNRANGYGQYVVEIDVNVDGKVTTSKFSTNDSEIFDIITMMESASEREEFLKERFSHLCDESLEAVENE